MQVTEPFYASSGACSVVEYRSRRERRKAGKIVKDYRTEDQKVAAVAASMTMAGQPVTPQDEARGRRILRGEISGDQAVLEVLEEEGLADSAHAAELRRRIAAAA